MSHINTYILSILFLITLSDGKLTEYLKKCKKGSAGAECALENAVAAVEALSNNRGEPEYKLFDFDPIHIDFVDFQIATGLTLALSDMNCYGSNTTKFISAQINDNEISLTAYFGKFELVGNYDMDGYLLLIPIKGKGTCNITLSDYYCDYTAKLATVERGGKMYYQVDNRSSYYKIRRISRVYYNFGNLFNGDKEQDIAINKFLNDNWRDVLEAVEEIVNKLGSHSVFDYIVNAYLYQTTIDELFD